MQIVEMARQLYALAMLRNLATTRAHLSFFIENCQPTLLAFEQDFECTTVFSGALEDASSCTSGTAAHVFDPAAEGIARWGDFLGLSAGFVRVHVTCDGRGIFADFYRRA